MPREADFRSSSGHPGMEVGLKDGIAEGAYDGCIDKLGDELASNDGGLEGSSVGMYVEVSAGNVTGGLVGEDKGG